MSTVADFLKLGFEDTTVSGDVPGCRILLQAYAGMGHYWVLVENITPKESDQRFRLGIIGGAEGHGVESNWREFLKESDPKSGEWWSLEETLRYAQRRSRYV